MATRLHRYQLLSKIASGGMAEVYAAVQWGDGGFSREVVIKRMHPHLCERREMVEDFRQEAMLLAQLDIPGVPAVHDFRCGPDGVWYLAMERVRGVTLATALNNGPLPIPVTVAVARGLCEILDAVHGARDDSGQLREIVHGDLTPGNVILRHDGRIALLDFGIAGDQTHRASRVGEEHGIRGTIGYVAPEIVAPTSTLADARADVFSVAVLLFEATTGVRPYPEDSLAYMNALREGPVPRPGSELPDYPEQLADIVVHALSHDPASRTSSARTLADQLAALEQGDVEAWLSSRFEESVPFMPGEPPEDMFALPARQLTPEEAARLVSGEEHDDILADLSLFADEDLGNEPEFLSVPPLELLQPPPVPEAAQKNTPPVPPPAVKDIPDPPVSDTPPLRISEPSIDALFAEIEASRSGELPLELADEAPRSSPLPPAMRHESVEMSEVPISDRPTPPAPRPSVAPTQTQTRAKRPADRAISSNPPDSDGFYIHVADDD